MQKRTAQKAADLLGLVEALLDQSGRPRKLPGKPRPEALDLNGEPTTIRGKDLFAVTALSLPAAFKLAAKEMGYTPTVLNAAIEAFEDAAFDAGWTWTISFRGIEGLDQDYWDTRDLIRYARRARKTVEMEAGLR